MSDWKKWIAENVDDGDKVAEWDGGDDSGSVNGCISEMPSGLEDAMTGEINDTLDYGSWAGEFTAWGKAIKRGNELILEDKCKYRYDGEVDKNASITIAIPISQEMKDAIIEVVTPGYIGGEFSGVEAASSESLFSLILKDGIQPEDLNSVLEYIRSEIEDWDCCEHDYFEIGGSVVGHNIVVNCNACDYEVENKQYTIPLKCEGDEDA